METKLQDGYLILADISGYTSYLAGTELEHAHEILGELINNVISHFSPTLSIAEVEGDAVFAFVPASKISRGETLLELIETTYLGFRDHRDSMRRHTTCTCDACVRIGTLDLKFITHFGQFIMQSIAGRQKPVGSDVNLVHRLLKNGVSMATGWEGYALFSGPSLERLGIMPEACHKQKENYEHLGEIATESINLHERYRVLKDERRNFVTADDCHAQLTHVFTAPRATVWEWLNDPSRRALWMDGTTWTGDNRPNGRTDAGATNHCHHGKGKVIDERILDWRPFDYCTVEYGFPMRFTKTERLEPADEGTRLEAYYRIDLPLPAWTRRLFARLLVGKMMKATERWNTMAQCIEKEAAANRLETSGLETVGVEPSSV